MSPRYSSQVHGHLGWTGSFPKSGGSTGITAFVGAESENRYKLKGDDLGHWSFGLLVLELIYEYKNLWKENLLQNH